MDAMHNSAMSHAPSTGGTSASTPILDVHDMTVAYHRKPVLWDIDLSIPVPTLACIIGPNGAGKSTFIKAVLGLIPLASGSVQVFGEPIDRVRKRIGYVPQRESVDWDFPVNVLDVVLMGTYGHLGWFRRPGHGQRQWALECLDQVGMADLASRQIGQLSGGQQQRTFLARALAQKAELYLMDEPLAGVDAATEEVVFKLLTRLRGDGKTVVVVHHDLRTVPTHYESVIMLNMRLVAAGPTEETFTNDNLHKTYGGRLAILEAAGEAIRTQERSA
jgi:manganese/zinc/iron transport system ATP- binding protein